MRTITQKAVNAFLNAVPFKSPNTIVEVLDNVTILKLHSHPIAYLYNDPKKTLSVTNAGWFSNTTKERLNGLPNVRVNQKAEEWFLNGVKWDGNLIEVK